MRILIDEQQAGNRLDVALKNSFGELSRGRIQKAIKDGYCQIDGVVVTDPSAKTRLNQTIDCAMPQNESALTPANGEINILWQDEHIAVCVKPAGLTVHPAPSCKEKTFANRLIAAFPQLALQDSERPGIVHRLDKNTSGLIIVALTDQAHNLLTQQFQNRQIHKNYLALVSGLIPEKGQCQEAIGRHPAIKTRMAAIPEKSGGKCANTQWRRLWHTPDREVSLVDVAIHTGRTHQIRVHLAHLGFPLLGDEVYAPKSVAELAERQMLHAWKLKFHHPLTGKLMEFSTPPPDDFLETVRPMCHKMQKIVVTGNQGCGKSTFCRHLQNMGMPVTSADAIVARLYEDNAMIKDWLMWHFGSDVIAKDGKVDKQALMRELERRPYMRKELQMVIFPIVFAEIDKFWQDNAHEPCACAEIPLYFESGEKIADAYTVGINCPEKLRWQRIAATRGWDEKKISSIEKWQWPEERKMAACCEVIDNAGTDIDLQEKARSFYDKVMERAKMENQRIIEEFCNICGLKHGD